MQQDAARRGTHTGDPHRGPTQRGPTQGTPTGDPHRGPTQGTQHTEGRAPQRTHHRRGGPHRGPTQTQNTHSTQTFICVESRHGTPQQGRLEKWARFLLICCLFNPLPSVSLQLQSPSPRYISSFSPPPLGISPPASVPYPWYLSSFSPLPSVSLQLQSPSPRYLSSFSPLPSVSLQHRPQASGPLQAKI